MTFATVYMGNDMNTLISLKKDQCVCQRLQFLQRPLSVSVSRAASAISVKKKTKKKLRKWRFQTDSRWKSKIQKIAFLAKLNIEITAFRQKDGH